MSSALDCVDRSSPRLDQLAAYEVAWWFLAAPRDGRDPLVVCAYAELQAQTDRLFAELTDLDNPLGVRVSFTTCQAPYASAEELIHAVRTQRELEVISTPRGGDGCHPMFECEPGGPYDRFRAVHDIAGHPRLGLGFDRDGEYATWLAQDAQYRGLAVGRSPLSSTASTVSTGPPASRPSTRASCATRTSRPIEGGRTYADPRRQSSRMPICRVSTFSPGRLV